MIIFDDSKLPIETIGNLLNDMNAEVNFTLETNGNEINFLDLTIYKRDQTVETDIFYEPTDSKQNLNFYFHHPHHSKVAIPHNLARRICAIVSEFNTRILRLEDLKVYLKNAITQMNSLMT